MTKLIALVIVLFSLTKVTGQTVYSTPSGARYHKADCRSVKNVSTRLEIKAAVEKGLTPCKICKPPAAVVYGAPMKKLPEKAIRYSVKDKLKRAIDVGT